MSGLFEVLRSTAPVIALFAVGYLLRRIRFFEGGSIDELRKLVLYVALPALLFTVFENLPLSGGLVSYFAIVFAACGVLTGIGVVLSRVSGLRSGYAPFMFTGFETGMLGYAIFISAFGAENASKLASFDLGQLFFVWMVLIGPLLRLKTSTRNPGEIAVMFFRSPVIIGILAGLAANVLGERVFRSAVVFDTLESVARTASLITVPLISIIIGYSFTVDRRTLKDAVLTIVLRVPVILGLAFLLERTLLYRLLSLGPLYRGAFVTMFLLPPPFVYTLFLRPHDEIEGAYLATTYSLHSLLSILLFIVIVPLVV